MDPFSISTGPGPLVAAAVHDGHAAHPDTLARFALDDAQRLREEDPFTGELAAVAETRIVGQRSRFEVDLNRPPEGAVYRTPEDAWGLTVWTDDLPQSAVTRAMGLYDAFYEAVEKVLDEKVRTYGSVVVYDLHSYNHRREGPDGPTADPEANPEVNIGTGTLDARWRPLVDRFMTDLREGAADAGLADLDVRENVKFQGGHFSRWIHRRFGPAACVLAVEFKKTFMDEWTGEPDREHLRQLREALAATVPGAMAEREAITTAAAA
ncbi:MAG TPA: N-formylglutamate amidohydrolase [Bacteroidetes bacterium]|nr:N-formylglutamate amidohydrolase [Bacteroidota bacterium]HIL57168.1 N-formylglutamate amidohydrolase [Rhodothermales bacterium]